VGGGVGGRGNVDGTTIIYRPNTPYFSAWTVTDLQALENM